MFHINVPIGLGLALAFGAGSQVWTAQLEGRDGSKMSGTAQVESAAVMPDSTAPVDTAQAPQKPGELNVTITVSDAPADASLSWYVYGGSCKAESAGDAESIVGLPSSYSPIKVDGSGNGTITLTIQGAQMPTGMYYVGVISGGKLAACGNLEPSKTSTGG
jgi:hypothetical protein